ncbi:hypothetical protein [Candidatus Chloroploca asiatica]|uniref:Uncharacterized protein n=1 Tax=Candidatus Chloroploca asiatica TaxID=1506545 RepID=A0A2H3KP99_9CHLR|nr:hypothetical protein [Candidatus Chloroploca asiatica]PDV99963.1 hypothetical protein A9Q02_11050 [Candidatus Chloroploca asiatica]
MHWFPPWARFDVLRFQRYADCLAISAALRRVNGDHREPARVPPPRGCFDAKTPRRKDLFSTFAPLRLGVNQQPYHCDDALQISEAVT